MVRYRDLTYKLVHVLVLSIVVLDGTFQPSPSPAPSSTKIKTSFWNGLPHKSSNSSLSKENWFLQLGERSRTPTGNKGSNLAPLNTVFYNRQPSQAREQPTEGILSNDEKMTEWQRTKLPWHVLNHSRNLDLEPKKHFNVPRMIRTRHEQPMVRRYSHFPCRKGEQCHPVKQVDHKVRHESTHIRKEPDEPNIYPSRPVKAVNTVPQFTGRDENSHSPVLVTVTNSANRESSGFKLLLENRDLRRKETVFLERKRAQLSQEFSGSAVGSLFEAMAFTERMKSRVVPKDTDVSDRLRPYNDMKEIPKTKGLTLNSFALKRFDETAKHRRPQLLSANLQASSTQTSVHVTRETTISKDDFSERETRGPQIHIPYTAWTKNDSEFSASNATADDLDKSIWQTFVNGSRTVVLHRGGNRKSRPHRHLTGRRKNYSSIISEISRKSLTNYGTTYKERTKKKLFPRPSRPGHLNFAVVLQGTTKEIYFKAGEEKTPQAATFLSSFDKTLRIYGDSLASQVKTKTRRNGLNEITSSSHLSQPKWERQNPFPRAHFTKENVTPFKSFLEKVAVDETHWSHWKVNKKFRNDSGIELSGSRLSMQKTHSRRVRSMETAEFKTAEEIELQKNIRFLGNERSNQQTHVKQTPKLTNVNKESETPRTRQSRSIVGGLAESFKSGISHNKDIEKRDENIDTSSYLSGIQYGGGISVSTGLQSSPKEEGSTNSSSSSVTGHRALKTTNFSVNNAAKSRHPHLSVEGKLEVSASAKRNQQTEAVNLERKVPPLPESTVGENSALPTTQMTSMVTYTEEYFPVVTDGFKLSRTHPASPATSSDMNDSTYSHSNVTVAETDSAPDKPLQLTAVNISVLSQTSTNGTQTIKQTAKPFSRKGSSSEKSEAVSGFDSTVTSPKELDEEFVGHRQTSEQNAKTEGFILGTTQHLDFGGRVEITDSVSAFNFSLQTGTQSMRSTGTGEKHAHTQDVTEAQRSTKEEYTSSPATGFSATEGGGHRDDRYTVMQPDDSVTVTSFGDWEMPYGINITENESCCPDTPELGPTEDRRADEATSVINSPNPEIDNTLQTNSKHPDELFSKINELSTRTFEHTQTEKSISRGVDEITKTSSKPEGSVISNGVVTVDGFHLETPGQREPSLGLEESRSNTVRPTVSTHTLENTYFKQHKSVDNSTSSFQERDGVSHRTVYSTSSEKITKTTESVAYSEYAPFLSDFRATNGGEMNTSTEDLNNSVSIVYPTHSEDPVAEHFTQTVTSSFSVIRSQSTTDDLQNRGTELLTEKDINSSNDNSAKTDNLALTITETVSGVETTAFSQPSENETTGSYDNTGNLHTLIRTERDTHQQVEEEHELYLGDDATRGEPLEIDAQTDNFNEYGHSNGQRRVIRSSESSVYGLGNQQVVEELTPNAKTLNTGNQFDLGNAPDLSAQGGISVNLSIEAKVDVKTPYKENVDPISQYDFEVEREIPTLAFQDSETRERETVLPENIPVTEKSVQSYEPQLPSTQLHFPNTDVSVRISTEIPVVEVTSLVDKVTEYFPTEFQEQTISITPEPESPPSTDSQPSQESITYQTEPENNVETPLPSTEAPLLEDHTSTVAMSSTVTSQPDDETAAETSTSAESSLTDSFTVMQVPSSEIVATMYTTGTITTVATIWSSASTRAVETETTADFSETETATEVIEPTVPPTEIPPNIPPTEIPLNFPPTEIPPTSASPSATGVAPTLSQKSSAVTTEQSVDVVAKDPRTTPLSWSSVLPTANIAESFHFTIDADYDAVVGTRKEEFQQSLRHQLSVVMRLPLKCIQNLLVNRGSIEVSFDMVPAHEYGHLADEKALKAAADELKRLIDKGELDLEDLDGNKLVIVPLDPPTTATPVTETEHTTLILGVIIGAFVVTVVMVIITALIVKRKSGFGFRLSPIEEAQRKLPSYRDVPFQEALYVKGSGRGKPVGKYCYNSGEWLGPGPEPKVWVSPEPIRYRPPTDAEVRRTPRPPTSVVEQHVVSATHSD